MKHTPDVAKPLQGRRILVADDEFLIAITIEDTLRDAGAEIVLASTLPEALKAATDKSLSAALLDVRLGRVTTETVADALAARDIPFLFYSGQPLPERMHLRHPAAKVLVKPIRHETFVDEFRKILDPRSDGPLDGLDSHRD